MAKLAARVMAGKKLAELGFIEERIPAHVAVKESVFPFVRFPGVDTILGPEMKSTGEVMGLDTNFPAAFAKAELAASTNLPVNGMAFISVRDYDKAQLAPIVRGLAEMGFELIATDGTAAEINRLGISCERINKVIQGSPNIVDRMREGRVALVINTPGRDWRGRFLFNQAHSARIAPAVLHDHGWRGGSGQGDRIASGRSAVSARVAGLYGLNPSVSHRPNLSNWRPAKHRPSRVFCFGAPAPSPAQASLDAKPGPAASDPISGSQPAPSGLKIATLRRQRGSGRSGPTRYGIVVSQRSAMRRFICHIDTKICAGAIV